MTGEPGDLPSMPGSGSDRPAAAARACRSAPWLLQTPTRVISGLGALLMLVGCGQPSGPIFPEVNPPIVWPRAPDQPRIRYVGELRGESSLGIRPRGWDAVRAALAGPPALLDFSRPSAVAVAGDRVFVADTGLGVVHRLDLANRQYSTLRGPPDDALRVPISLTLAGDRLLVADRARSSVEVFDLDGTWRTTKRWPEVTAPVAVAWDAARRTLWLADAAAHACFATEDLETLSRQLG